MERELSLKRCKTCGKTVQILEDSNVEIMCCNENMETIVPNSVDAAIEKHVPEYTVEDGKILVKVNHVMEEEHYIEWICLVTDEKECKKYFKPGEVAETTFCYTPGSKLYAYCNKHGLWQNDVK